MGADYSRTPATGRTSRRLLCIGHRGAMGHAPENTLAGIRRAIELGAHGVEVDVRGVHGRAVLFHDARLERTTDGRGRLYEIPYEQVRRLDAGGGERVPTLDEAIDALDHAAWLNLELKDRSSVQPVIEVIGERVRAGTHTHAAFLVSSFEHAILDRVRELDPAVRIGLLWRKPPESFVDRARRFGAVSVHVAWRYVRADHVREAHAAGLSVYVYTVNEPHGIDRMRELGVDGIFTDYPDIITSGPNNGSCQDQG